MKCPCGAEAQGNRSFWKPTLCCSPTAPAAKIGRSDSTTERRTCPVCGRVFCVRSHRPHLTCSPSCATAQIAQANRINGGLTLTGGRWWITTRDGNYAYARGVMEGHLRRPLTDDEIVHHVNGDPSDDRIENLQLTDRRGHMAIHRADLETARARARRVKRAA